VTGVTDVVPPGPGRRRGPDTAQSPNRWMEDHLVRLGRGGTVLDLGCGRGYWLRRMARAGLAPVGLEYDPARAAEAGLQAPVVAGDATHLPLRAASVGVVWSIHVLHHLPDPPAVLAEVARVLRPGGHLIVAETVEDHPVVRLGRAIHPHWDGVGVHSRFRAATLLELLAGAGFEVVDSRQHSLVSFAAWALPVGDRAMWTALERVEGRLPVRFNRWGAHVEVVARRA
jgi:SAM-dependent methyltransferase